MVKTSVIEQAFWSRVSYAIIAILMLGIYLIYDNNLSNAFKNKDIVYCGAFLLNLSFSYYLFITCGKNPGYMTIDIEHSQNDVNIQMKDVNNMFLSKTDSTEIRNSDDHEANNNKEPLLVPEKHYCNACKVYQPIRTKHCDECEMCVYKYDHHCIWLGACIGEFNHRKFWIFLISQSILHIWCYSIACSGLDIYGWKTDKNIENDNDIEKLSTGYTTEYAAFMLCCFINFVFMLFCGVLWLYHTYLIITNQTTWEFTRRKQISYLRAYPNGFSPFNQGIIENLKLTFLHDNQRREWILPDLATINAQK